jgi:hypothetical protein
MIAENLRLEEINAQNLLQLGRERLNFFASDAMHRHFIALTFHSMVLSGTQTHHQASLIRQTSRQLYHRLASTNQPTFRRQISKQLHHHHLQKPKLDANTRNHDTRSTNATSLTSSTKQPLPKGVHKRN